MLEIYPKARDRRLADENALSAGKKRLNLPLLLIRAVAPTNLARIRHRVFERIRLVIGIAPHKPRLARFVNCAAAALATRAGVVSRISR